MTMELLSLFLITGYTNNDLIFETDTIKNSSEKALFIAKYDTTGTYQDVILTAANPGDVRSIGVGQNQLFLAGDAIGQFSIGEIDFDLQSRGHFLVKYELDSLNESIQASLNGEFELCSNNLNNIIYMADSELANDYQWSISGGEIVGGTGTSQIAVNWLADCVVLYLSLPVT